jgi:hypothetical protein
MNAPTNNMNLHYYKTNMIPMVLISLFFLSFSNNNYCNPLLSHAFQPQPQLHPLSLSPPLSSYVSSSKLFSSFESSFESSRIKKAGCGLPTIPPGNSSLFNPEEQGKLQGTGSLSSRIHNANNYILSKDTGREEESNSNENNEIPENEGTDAAINAKLNEEIGEKHFDTLEDTFIKNDPNNDNQNENRVWTSTSVTSTTKTYHTLSKSPSVAQFQQSIRNQNPTKVEPMLSQQNNIGTTRIKTATPNYNDEVTSNTIINPDNNTIIAPTTTSPSPPPPPSPSPRTMQSNENINKKGNKKRVSFSPSDVRKW